MKIDLGNTENKYSIVYIDPPWEQTKSIRKCRPNQKKQLDYKTCSLEEIKDLIAIALSNTSDYHNIFMWTIDKFLHQTEQMLQELGYVLHARMVWDKTNGVAPAFTVRYSHEYLLWFYKKNRMLKPVNHTRGKYRTVFVEKSTKHSKKPQCVYEMLEDMFPDVPKLEMFARNCRNGWDCWGDEV